MTRTGSALTAADVVASVRNHFGAERDGIGPEWAALEEFSLGTGAGRQRADLFLVRAWPGRPLGHERIAVEVKVSRSDLLHELAHPEKSAAFMDVAHRFYLAVPKGLLRPDDPIPAEWGVLEALRSSCRKIRVAPRREDPEPLPEAALVEAFRRAARAEARIRGAADTDPARIPALIKDLAAAQNAEYRAKQAAHRDRTRLRDFLAAVTRSGGWFCVCGQPVKKPLSGLNDYRGTQHADGSITCTRGQFGRPEHDLGRAAASLGIDLGDRVESAAAWNALPAPSAFETLEQIRSALPALLDATPEAREETIARLTDAASKVLDPYGLRASA